MDLDSPFPGFALPTNPEPQSPQLEVQISLFFGPEIQLTSTTEDQPTFHAHLSPILESSSPETSTRKESEGNSLKRVTRGATTRSSFFGPTSSRTKTRWTLIDTRPSSSKSAEPYQSPQEESSPTKLIISAASSQERLSANSSNSPNRSKWGSTKLSVGTQTSKQDYELEDTTKLPSTSANKQLISQSPTDTLRRTEQIPPKSSKTYPKTSTRTSFIATRNTNISTSEESSPDSTTRKEKTTTIRGSTMTKKSEPPQIYNLLNSSRSSSKSEQLQPSLSHRQVGIVTRQDHTYILYPGKQPVEVESLEEALPLRPPYKRPLPKKASKPLHRSKNPSKSILKNKIQIENLLTIRSQQLVRCRQILEILHPRDQQWPNPHPSTETERGQSSSSMKST